MSGDKAEGHGSGAGGPDEGPAMSSQSATCAPADAGDAPQLPPAKKPHKKRKASKGRLKKLWRRAAGPPPGIASRGEWVELMELHSEWRRREESPAGGGGGGGGVATDREAMRGPLPGPSVLLAQKRDFGDVERWQRTEGSDHRDILLNFLFGDGGVDDGNSVEQQKKKKRKLNPPPSEEGRSQTTLLVHVPPLPSWSHISNLGSVGGVAVIEIEINGGDAGATCPLMPSQQIKDATTDGSTANVWSTLQPGASGNGNGEAKRTIGAACKVKLFQGTKQPRCLSDVLMFLPPPPSGGGTTQQIGCADLFVALNDLLLKPEELRLEGYPVVTEAAPAAESSDGTMDVKLAKEAICKMSATAQLAPLANEQDTLELVRALSVNAVLGDDSTDEGEGADEFAKMEHFVKTFTHCDAGDKRQPKIFALDGEFVRTSAGPELARVSVIVYSGEKDGEKSTVVLDELCKPRRKVLDYLTEFSGITAKMLEGIETRLESIQIKLLSLIDQSDILVGHSLENDLRALRLVHTRIIDTSVVFRGNNGRKISLRHLANVLLQRKIQQGCGSTGHCSTEDAEAALVLALRRARRGDSFRLKENSRRQSILGAFQKANRASNEHIAEANSFAERNCGSCVCIGPNEWIMKYAQSSHGSQHVLGCDSIMSSMSMAIPSWLSSEKSSKRAGFLWANLICEDKSAEWRNEAKKLNEILKALVDRVPYHIPILLIYQQNYKKAFLLTQQRKAALNPKATAGWTSVQEEEWETCVEQSRYGEAIWIGSTCAENK